MSFLALLCASALSAHAGTVEDQIKAAQKALAAKNIKEAEKALKTAEKAAPDATALVSQATVAQLHFYRGMAYYLKGDTKGRDMDAWRKALVADNEFQWDSSLSNSEDGQSLFEALRREVRGRSKVDSGVYERSGRAEIYVDGVRAQHGDQFLSGIHLGQIVCDDKSVYGLWTDLTRQVDWFSLCPDGVDTSVVVAAEQTEDEWAEFGPAFGAPADKEMLDGGIGTDDPTAVTSTETEAEPTPEPEKEEPAKEEPAKEAVATAEASETSSDKESAEPVTEPKTETAPDDSPSPKSDRSSTFTIEPKLVLLAGGSTLFAGSLATNFLMVNPAYEEIEAINDNGASITREEAEQLEERFTQSKLITIALGGGGVALVGASFLLDSPVTLWAGPSQIGVRGRF